MISGFYHEITNLNRDEYVDIDFDAITKYEKASFLPVNRTRRRYDRCDQTRLGKEYGCRQVGAYDANSILHHPPTLTSYYDNTSFTVFTLKPSANALCENGKCTPGQRDGLSKGDISKIATLYRTSCGKKYARIYKHTS